jgi:hypothetical protein
MIWSLVMKELKINDNIRHILNHHEGDPHTGSKVLDDKLVERKDHHNDYLKQFLHMSFGTGHEAVKAT